MGSGATYKQIQPAGLAYILKNPDYLGEYLFEDYKGKDQTGSNRFHTNTPSKENIHEVSLDLVWTEILAVLEKFAVVPGEELPVTNAVIRFDASEIQPDDFGYDVRGLTDAQVSVLATKLDQISEETFWQNYDRETMSGWDFEEGWSEEDIELNRQNILARFKGLKEYYKDAATRGNAMLSYYS